MTYTRYYTKKPYSPGPAAQQNTENKDKIENPNNKASPTPGTKSTLEYQKFRVRGHIKSFRDLEIYKQTTDLASQIFLLTLPKTLPQKSLIQPELEILKQIAKIIPKTIAEAFGDRYTDRKLAYVKLENSMRTISILIAKIDFLIAMATHQDTKQKLVKLINKYQIQKRKTLNLKRAWEKTDEKFGQKFGSVRPKNE